MSRHVLLHNTALMPSRLIFAFALSLALHGAVLLSELMKRLPVAPPPPALQALLRLPPSPEMPQMPPESLLKNTLDPEENTPEVNKPSPAMLPLPSKNTVKREVQTAQRKLSEHLYYPPEAIAQGIEGEVRLILKLSADGAVEDINIAASSGHPVLDQAAIKAAYAMGKLVGATSHELILPVIFRLQ